MSQHKSLGRVTVKSEAEGTVSAVFSTFNVRDHDGDVTLPGAFDEGASVVISSYNHTSWGGSRPVGKGTIRTTRSEAIMDGQFFMDTADGRETFSVVKGLSESGLGEWSYGFEVLESEPGRHDGMDSKFIKRVKVFEVSPVLRGAGVNTRTVAVKALMETGMELKDATRLVERTVQKSEYRNAIPPHFSPSVVKAWEPDAVLTAMPTERTIDDLRTVFAWHDPNGAPEDIESYELAHHLGVGGEVNLRACYEGLWALNSGRIDIPEADRQGVYAHLAGHILDADREPLELRSVVSTGPLTFQEEIVRAMVVNADLRKRASEVMALRARKGKSVAAASADLLEWWSDEMRETRAVLDTPQDDAAREFLRFMQAMQNEALQNALDDVEGTDDNDSE